MIISGRIIKAISGFYYVQTETEIIECKARGRFRKEGITPLVGDLVDVTHDGNKGILECIHVRKNAFIRPAVANLDLIVLLVSEVIPITEPFLIDRITSIAGDQNVPVVICVNKCDLTKGDRLANIYEHAGYQVVRTSAVTGEGVNLLRQLICGKTCAFSGNSGVGKSSILNCLAPSLSLPTGDVSQRLGRGRHTTRHVELYCIGKDSYVADTPGFSSFDTEMMDLILKENLQYAFPDFAPFIGQCQFHDCSHLKEPGCGIRTALMKGYIQPTRYDSYARLYEKAKQIKLWQIK